MLNCQENLNPPARAPVHPWEWPECVWSCVHVDSAGPFEGSMFLLVVDTYSKWMEVVPIRHATSQTTIDKLRVIFAIHGLPEMLVSDNGTSFTSAEFQEFVSSNAIRHVLTSPYYPASKRLTEKAVQTFKSAMRKMSTGPLESWIARFLFPPHLTPTTTTGNAPAELLLGQAAMFTA